MSESQIVYIPGGRFVSGDLTKKRTKNARGQDIPVEKQQFEVGIAVRKDEPQVGNMFAQFAAGAKAVCPANVHPYIDNWFQTLDGFSMKIADGDKPSLKTGKANPNTAGCWVVYLSSSFPFNCYDNTNAQMDPAALKRGWYVDCTATIAYNGQAPMDGAGIFVNPGMFRCLGVGEEIKGGLDEAAHMAAMAAPQLPPGAQPMGSAPAAPAMPGAGPVGMVPGVQPPAMQPAGVPMQQQPAPMGVPAQPAQATPPGVPQQAPAGAPANPMQAPPGIPAAGMAPMSGAVPGGVPQPAPVGVPGTTASPSETPAGVQPYPGIMTPGT